MNDSSYVPGMCNINTAEVAYRKKAMWSGVAIAAAILIACLIANINPLITAALLFIPTYVAAIGYLQVKNKFCVSYGASGQQHADDEQDAQRVDDSAAVAADKQKARNMNMQALLITIVLLVALAGLLSLR